MCCYLICGLLIGFAFSSGHGGLGDDKLVSVSVTEDALESSLQQLIAQWKMQRLEPVGFSATILHRTYDTTFAVERLDEGKITWVSSEQ